MHANKININCYLLSLASATGVNMLLSVRMSPCFRDLAVATGFVAGAGFLTEAVFLTEAGFVVGAFMMYLTTRTTDLTVL